MLMVGKSQRRYTRQWTSCEAERLKEGKGEAGDIISMMRSGAKEEQRLLLKATSLLYVRSTLLPQHILRLFSRLQNTSSE